MIFATTRVWVVSRLIRFTEWIKSFFQNPEVTSVPELTEEEKLANSRNRLRAIAHSWKPSSRQSWSDPDPVAVAVLGDHPGIAAEIRRVGLPCFTVWTGKLSKQLAKAAQYKAEVAIFAAKEPGFFMVKDMWTGEQKQIASANVLDEVAEVLENGYYDPNESTEDFLERLHL